MVSHDNVHLQTDKLGGKPRVSLNLPAREPILDGDALALDVSELAQPLPEGVDFWRGPGRSIEASGAPSVSPQRKVRRSITR